MSEVKLNEVAKTIRSKNAGIDLVTFDVIFADQEVYTYVKEHRLITKEQVADLYGISEEAFEVFVYFDPAKAVKFTINRPDPSGNPGEHDVYGAQKYAPMFDYVLSLPEELTTGE